MRSATVANTAAPARMDRSMSVEPRFQLAPGNNDKLLNVDLSDLVLPKINDLHVDGLKQSWLSRLFGKN